MRKTSKVYANQYKLYLSSQFFLYHVHIIFFNPGKTNKDKIMDFLNLGKYK